MSAVTLKVFMTLITFMSVSALQIPGGIILATLLQVDRTKWTTLMQGHRRAHGPHVYAHLHAHTFTHTHTHTLTHSHTQHTHTLTLSLALSLWGHRRARGASAGHRPLPLQHLTESLETPCSYGIAYCTAYRVPTPRLVKKSL